jgi:peptide deformylase
MSRKIISYPDPVLARKSRHLTGVDPDIEQLATDMVETMYDNEGIGLAAPQVGENVRLIVVDISGPEIRQDLRVLLNPEIVAASGEVESDEGCLSVPKYRAPVMRSETVTVQAQDLEGNDLEIEADGMLAICLQHEIDHLDGVLFIDHISRLKRSMYDKKVKKWLKQGTIAD